MDDLNPGKENKNLDSIRHFKGTWKEFEDFWKSKGARMSPWEEWEQEYPKKKKMVSKNPVNMYKTFDDESDEIKESSTSFDFLPFVEFINEAKKVNEGKDQERLTYFRKLGIAPNNQPQNSAYIKQVSKPGKFFVDWKNIFDLGDVALEFVKSVGSISEFDIIDLKTMKRTGKQLDVKKGQLGSLRTTYGVKLKEDNMVALAGSSQDNPPIQKPFVLKTNKRKGSNEDDEDDTQEVANVNTVGIGTR